MVVSYYLRKVDLEKIDIIALWRTLKAIGYKVFVGNGLRVETTVDRYESKEHVYKEMILDIESLLKRFKIKK